MACELKIKKSDLIATFPHHYSWYEYCAGNSWWIFLSSSFSIIWYNNLGLSSFLFIIFSNNYQCFLPTSIGIFKFHKLSFFIFLHINNHHVLTFLWPHLLSTVGFPLLVEELSITSSCTRLAVWIISDIIATCFCDWDIL